MDQQYVIDYYEKTLSDYKLIFFRKNNFSMHYGYWGKKVKNYQDALLRINGVIAEKLGLTNKDFVLDAGCGLGETCFWLANNVGCHVEGVSITPAQIKIAKNLAKKKAKGKKISFRVIDYTKTDYPDNYFDAVVAIEAICHLQDKSVFYKEMYRILKPSGRLAVAEFVLRKLNMNTKQKNEIRRWLDGWAIPNLWTPDNHVKTMKKVGFVNVSAEDYSDRVVNTAKYLYFNSLIGIPIYTLMTKIGIIGDLRLKNAYACKYQWVTKKENLWRHNLFIAKKK